MEQLTEKQALSISILFITGASIVIGVAKVAKENAWISLIIAAILCIPIFFIFLKILKTFEGKNIFEIFEFVFGRILGKFFTTIFLVSVFYNVAIVLRILAEFIFTTGLNGTPRLLIITLIISLVTFIVKKGIHIYGRWCTIFLSITIIVIIFTSILQLPSSDFNKLRPIMYDGFDPVLKGAISTLAMPISQVGLLLGMANYLNPKASKRRLVINILLISTILLLIIVIGDISIIGGDLYKSSYFPSYMTLRRLNVGETIQRVEIFVVALFMVVNFSKIVSITFIALLGFQKLFDLDHYKNISTPIIFLIGILAFLAYGNLIEFNHLALEIYPKYAPFIHVGFPTLAYIVYLVKRFFLKKINKNSNNIIS